MSLFKKEVTLTDDETRLAFANALEARLKRCRFSNTHLSLTQEEIKQIIMFLRCETYFNRFLEQKKKEE